jgi:NAD+ synthase
MNELSKKIIDWISEYLVNSNQQGFVVGVSGGVDSALVSTLCARSGKPTVVLSMPIHQDKSQLSRAHKHIEWLVKNYSNVSTSEYDLTNLFNNFENLFQTKNSHASANTRSRLRMVTLYHVAALASSLVVGTGNKVEDFGVGFYTKYGDGGVDISPIADLTKSEVRDMAKFLGIDSEIVTAKPTDGLWEDNRTDEDQIGASYEELEWAMNNNYSENLSDRQKEVLDIYLKFNKQNKHKMVSIPVFKK